MWPPRASWENPCRRSPARGGHLKLIQPETDLYVDLYCDRPAILLGRFKAPLPDCFYRLLVETETGDARQRLVKNLGRQILRLFAVLYPARYVGVDPIEIVFIQLGKVGGIPFRQDAGTGRGAKRSLYFFFSPFFVSALGLASSFFSAFSEESPFEDEPGADDFLA